MKKYILIALGLLIISVAAPKADAALSLVGATSSFQATSTTTIPIVFTTQANDLIVVAGGGSSDQMSAPTDSAGNAYTLVATTTNTGTGLFSMYYSANTAAIATTTCRFALSSNVDCTIFDIGGAATTSPLDTSVAQGQLNAVTVATSGIYTTSNANDFIIFSVKIGANQGTSTAGSGFTIPANGATSTRQSTQYQIVSVGQLNATTSITFAAAGNTMGILAAFKAAPLAPAPSSSDFSVRGSLTIRNSVTIR